MRRRWTYIVWCLACALCLLRPASAEELRGPAEVIDGDIIRIAEMTVRLFGVDAPEQAQSCNTAAGKAYLCGETAHDCPSTYSSKNPSTEHPNVD